MRFLVVIMFAVLALSCKTASAPIQAYLTFPAAGTYRILGRVSVSMPRDDSGYNKLLKAAKAKFPECDDVVNVFIDGFWTAGSLSPKYSSVIMSGIAIDYDVDSVKDHEKTSP